MHRKTRLSCQSGQPLSKNEQKRRLKEAEKVAEAAASDLAKAGTSAGAQKYAAFRFGLQIYTEQRLHWQLEQHHLRLLSACGLRWILGCLRFLFL